MLQAELFAITLVLLTRKRNALTTGDQALGDVDATDIWDLSIACQRVASDLASALSLPCFGQGAPAEQKPRGITEGRSRSLFCLWALDAYRAGGGSLDDVFWGKLGTRLNGAD